jgi:hypothetical protein
MKFFCCQSWRISCGHRSCPKCQNHEASQWIDRQLGKLLPVPYYLVTFTLPYELKSVTWLHQKMVYSILFICVSSTLKDFLNDKKGSFSGENIPGEQKRVIGRNS